MANEPKLNLRFQDSDLKGHYSNYMQVKHTKEEFVLDFFSVFPPPAGVLLSRIIVSPGHLKRMVNALGTMLESYEKQFERVEPAEEPKMEMGFQPPEREEE